MKQIIRNIQTYFPALQDFKYESRFVYRKLFNKPCEKDFEALRLLNIPENAFIVDIGANRGETLQTVKIILPNSCIKAFEPNPIVAAKTAKKFSNDKSIEVLNLGLGDVVGSFKLYVPYYRGWMFDSLASLSKESAGNWLKTRMWKYEEKLLSIKEFTIEVRTLDSYELKPDFIKIDVQDFELQVLRGAQETISKYKPYLLLETPTDEVVKYLKQFGYSPYYLKDNFKLAPGFGMLNTFFQVMNT